MTGQPPTLTENARTHAHARDGITCVPARLQGGAGRDADRRRATERATIDSKACFYRDPYKMTCALGKRLYGDPARGTPRRTGQNVANRARLANWAASLQVTVTGEVQQTATRRREVCGCRAGVFCEVTELHEGTQQLVILRPAERSGWGNHPATAERASCTGTGPAGGVREGGTQRGCVYAVNLWQQVHSWRLRRVGQIGRVDRQGVDIWAQNAGTDQELHELFKLTPDLVTFCADLLQLRRQGVNLRREGKGRAGVLLRLVRRLCAGDPQPGDHNGECTHEHTHDAQNDCEHAGCIHTHKYTPILAKLGGDLHRNWLTKPRLAL